MVASTGLVGSEIYAHTISPRSWASVGIASMFPSLELGLTDDLSLDVPAKTQEEKFLTSMELDL